MQNSVTQFTQMFPPLIPQLHDVDIDSRPGNWLLPIHAKSLKTMLLPIYFSVSLLQLQSNHGLHTCKIVLASIGITWKNSAEHFAAITSQSIIIISLVFRRALNLHGSWVPDCNYLVGWSRLDLSPLCKGNCSVAQRDKRRDLPGQNTVTGLILHYIHKTTIIIRLMRVCVTHELYWLPLATGCWMVVGVESFSHEQSIVTRTFVRKPCWHGHKQTVNFS